MALDIRTETGSLEVGSPSLAGGFLDSSGSTDITESDIGNFERRFANELACLDRSMQGANVKKAALEGGHIYVNERPSAKHVEELKITALVRNHLLRARLLEVEDVLFIDDYHPKQQVLDVKAYKALAHRLGWPVEHVYYEKDMVPIADEIIAILRQAKLALARGSGLVLARGSGDGPHLLNPDNGQYSCALLDAALCQVKLGELGADGILNVVQNKWRHQQRNTREILRAVMQQSRLPFFNFYCDPEQYDSCVAGYPHYYRKVRPPLHNVR